MDAASRASCEQEKLLAVQQQNADAKKIIGNRWKSVAVFQHSEYSCVHIVMSLCLF